jgi:hypothetical protein
MVDQLGTQNPDLESCATSFTFNSSDIDRANGGNIQYVFLCAWLLFSAHQTCLSYVDQATAQSPAAPLAFVDSSGNVNLKVDNTTNANGDPNFGHNTVMMISKDTIDINTLLVMDVNHIPFGVRRRICSRWQRHRRRVCGFSAVCGQRSGQSTRPSLPNQEQT